MTSRCRTVSAIVVGFPFLLIDCALAVSSGAMRPCPEWQRCTGSFRIQEGVHRFAMMIQTSGKQSEGFTPGKLFVDDAEITPKTYPEGELRAIRCGLPKAKDRDAGVREIVETVAKLRASGFNTLSLGELIQAAKQQKLQVTIRGERLE